MWRYDTFSALWFSQLWLYLPCRERGGYAGARSGLRGSDVVACGRAGWTEYPSDHGAGGQFAVLAVASVPVAVGLGVWSIAVAFPSRWSGSRNEWSPASIRSC
jgi:hypothetical protein